MGTTLFAVAVAPLLISSIAGAVVTCLYFARLKKEADQARRGWMRRPLVQFIGRLFLAGAVCSMGAW